MERIRLKSSRIEPLNHCKRTSNVQRRTPNFERGSGILYVTLSKFSVGSSAFIRFMGSGNAQWARIGTMNGINGMPLSPYPLPVRSSRGEGEEHVLFRAS